MYCIEFYHKSGAVDWLRPWFSTKWAARRFAKKHSDIIGTAFTVRRV